jgi:hypothetical protein
MPQTLPLTVTEQMLFWEDRPAYPWSGFFRLRFLGVPDRSALQNAVTVALERHPLFRSRVEQTGRSRLRWVIDESPAPAFHWTAGPTGGPFPSATHLDVRREIGMRLQVIHEPDRADLLIHMHHCSSDALGTFQFIHDLLLAYANAVGGSHLPLPPLDPQRLHYRGRFGLNVGTLLRLLPKQMVGLLGARQFLMRRPRPLVPCRAAPPDAPLPPQYPAVLSHFFGPEETRRLREAARRQAVTVNDLLGRDLFLALHAWRHAQGVADEDSWLRLMVPVNLRTDGDRQLPAANVVSSVFLDRRGRDCDDAVLLLQSIHDEMDLIKRLQLGFTFVFSLHVARYLPGGLRAQSRGDKCKISCIFTNLGSILADSPLPRSDARLVAGNLILDQMDVVPPYSPYTCAAFSVGSYADRLFITLHYDPRPLSADQAASLLATYAAQIRTAL